MTPIETDVDPNSLLSNPNELVKTLRFVASSLCYFLTFPGLDLLTAYWYSGWLDDFFLNEVNDAGRAMPVYCPKPDSLTRGLLQTSTGTRPMAIRKPQPVSCNLIFEGFLQDGAETQTDRHDFHSKRLVFPPVAESSYYWDNRPVQLAQLSRK